MKSCWIVVKDNQSVLEFREAAIPQPARGEIAIRVRATALNRGELIVGGAVHGGPERIGGAEAAGEVHAVGEGVTAFKPGERVMARVRGGFAEYCTTPAHQALPLPASQSFEQGAAIPIAFLTCYEMLYPPYGKLKAGEWLLVAGVTSGVGVACVQTAKLIGAHTIGTSGSEQKLAKLDPLGLDVPIVTRKPDFADKVKAATGGRGADLMVNLVGGTVFAEGVRALARRGRMAIVGYVDGSFDAAIDLAAVHANRLEIFGISNSKATSEERELAMRNFSRDVLPAIVDGRIAPLIDRVFDFHQMPEAKAYMESSAMVGKIVVRVP